MSLIFQCVDAEFLDDAMCWCKGPRWWNVLTKGPLCNQRSPLLCDVLTQRSLMMPCVDTMVLDGAMCWCKVPWCNVLKWRSLMQCVEVKVLDAMCWSEGPWCNVLKWRSLMQCVEVKVLDAMCWSEGPWCNVLKWRSLMQWVDTEVTDGVMGSYKSILNSLWPSEVKWHHRSGSTLAQEIACCLIVA